MWTDIDLNECEIDLNECEIDLNKCEINRNVCEIDLNKCEFDLTKCEIDLNEIWDRSNYIAQSMQSGGTYASLPTYMIKEGLKIVILQFLKIHGFTEISKGTIYATLSAFSVV